MAQEFKERGLVTVLENLWLFTESGFTLVPSGSLGRISAVGETSEGFTQLTVDFFGSFGVQSLSGHAIECLAQKV